MLIHNYFFDILFIRMKKTFIVSIILSSIFMHLLFRNVNLVLADETILEDNFNGADINQDVWRIQNIGGQATVEDGFLKLSSENNEHFPLVSNLLPINNDSGPIEIDIHFKYPITTYWGTGISLGTQTPQYNQYPNNFPTDMANTHHVFVWQSINDSFLLGKAHCYISEECGFKYDVIDRSFPSNNIRNLKVRFDNDKTIVWLDEKVYTLNKIPKPKYLWIGNNEAVYNKLNWTSLWVDSVKITSITATKSPVLLVPGIGASWDYEAILKGASGGNWELPKFVGVYDNLINSFESAGYKKGEDLFIYAYDWRKSLIDQEKDLNKYIDSLVGLGSIDADSKIKIVGHSMGGLLGARYAENLGRDRVEKLVIAGSPFLGATDAYGAWEGGNVWGWPWYQRAALEMLLHFNKNLGESKVDTLRRMIPSIKELLPTTNYIQNLAGSEKNWSEMKQVNPTLPMINNNVTAIDELSFVLGGYGYETKNMITTKDRDWHDALLGRWEDGKPASQNPFSFSKEGDGTVLKDSAFSEFSNKEAISTNHRGIINDSSALEKILRELDLTSDYKGNVDLTEPQEVFVAALRSPGKLNVCIKDTCNEQLGIYDGENKLFMKPGSLDEEVTISVSSNGETGKYELHAGLLSDISDEWHSISSELSKPDETDVYKINLFEKDILIKASHGSLNDNLWLKSNKLNLLRPRWDKHGLLSVLTNHRLPIPIRLKAVDGLRQELKLVFDEGNTEASLLGLEVWKSIDMIAMELAEDKSNKANVNFDKQLKTLRLYQQSSQNPLAKSSNRFVAFLYEEAERLISLSTDIRIEYPKAAIEQLDSAKALLQAARAISLK